MNTSEKIIKELTIVINRLVEEGCINLADYWCDKILDIVLGEYPVKIFEGIVNPLIYCKD